MYATNTLFVMAQRSMGGIGDDEVHEWLAESQALAQEAGSENDQGVFDRRLSSPPIRQRRHLAAEAGSSAGMHHPLHTAQPVQATFPAAWPKHGL